MRIEKRLVVITGASSGIGLGLLQRFEKSGDKVIDISRHGRDFKCDVSDYSALKKVMDEIYKRHGEIDIVIACAGYGLNGAIEFVGEEEAKKQFDVNFFGTSNLCKYAIPKMKPNGKIIIMSSAMALLPVPYKAYYAASKVAVDRLAICLRMELSKTSIQVTSICPGDIKSDFTKNRVKQETTNARYGDTIANVIEQSEKKQSKRMPLEKAVNKIYKICEKKTLKSRYIIGLKYKLLNLARKVFPKELMVGMTENLYMKK